MQQSTFIFTLTPSLPMPNHAKMPCNICHGELHRTATCHHEHVEWPSSGCRTSLCHRELRRKAVERPCVTMSLPNVATKFIFSLLFEFSKVFYFYTTITREAENGHQSRHYCITPTPKTLISSFAWVQASKH